MGATTVIEIGLGILENQFETIHAFLIQVDPASQIGDLNRDNNRRTIEIRLPVTEPGVEPPHRPLVDNLQVSAKDDASLVALLYPHGGYLKVERGFVEKALGW